MWFRNLRVESDVTFLFRKSTGMLFLHNPNMFHERLQNKDLLFEVDNKRKWNEVKVDYIENRFIPTTVARGKNRRQCEEEYDYDTQCINSKLDPSVNRSCTTPWYVLWLMSAPQLCQGNLD